MYGKSTILKMLKLGLGIDRSVKKITAGTSFDPDAQLFITNAGITDATQQNALNNLVVSLKGYGIWTKMKAIYPFCGGTSTQHKYNLKDPRDLDAAFRLVFNGGWVHSSTGALPNRINTTAETKLIPSTILTNNNYHLSHYSRTQSTAFSVTDIGCYNTISSSALFMSQYYNNISVKFFIGGGYPTYAATVNNTDTRGFMIGSRISNTSAKIYMDGTQIAQNTNTNPAPLPTVQAVISSNNDNGAFYSDFSDKEVAFSSIGDGLTDTEAANYYTAVQAFQTSLSRNV
jgi:hypothetical protein